MNSKLRRLAQAQSNVARRSQLVEAGISPGFIRANLRARRWASFRTTVVIKHNGPLTVEQLRWAALLNAGPHAGLAGRTALAMAGLRGWEDEAVHILTPRGCTPPRVPGVNVALHETRVPAGRRLETLGNPARTRVERSAIDAAGWTRYPRYACGLLATVVQQRLSTGPPLLLTFHEAGPIRHRRVMRLALQDISAAHKPCQRSTSSGSAVVGTSEE